MTGRACDTRRLWSSPIPRTDTYRTPLRRLYRGNRGIQRKLGLGTEVQVL